MYNISIVKIGCDYMDAQEEIRKMKADISNLQKQVQNQNNILRKILRSQAEDAKELSTALKQTELSLDAAMNDFRESLKQEILSEISLAQHL